MNSAEQTLQYAAERLAVFSPLLEDVTLRALASCLAGPAEEKVALYCRFASAVYACGGDWGAHLFEKAMDCETTCLQMRLRGQAPPPAMAASEERELALLQALSALSPRQIALALCGQAGGLPLIANSPQQFLQGCRARQAEIATKGYGIYARYHMFGLGSGGALAPVKNPDPQSIAQLTGYQRERGQVIENTLSLLQGLPANNILLYGDAGTGKSSTVKAIANEYRGLGLRLIEVKKSQFGHIPGLMESLAESPLKFILFIDDLSFSETDDSFTGLKAVLEGDISARPANVVIYATSNRRNLVRESMQARLGGEVHTADALEETTSLSARFGLTVTFLKPNRELFAQIVRSLGAEYELETQGDELVRLAEAHALRGGGRSPRAAKQFIAYRKALERVSMEQDEEKA